jgi:hypothetical protein
MICGVCRFCGCTEMRACRLPEGEPCCWLDEAQTICSGCVEKLDERELLQVWIAEFQPVAGEQFSIALNLTTAHAVLGALQLALRHPQIGGFPGAADHVSHFAEALGDVLSQVGYAAREVVRRGFVGCHRPTAEPSPSNIILPEGPGQ